MVGSARGAANTRRIRRLKSPGGVTVEAMPDGTPRRLRIGSTWQDVTPARRPWRIDQHWWRGEPVRREYFRVVPETLPALTVYHDLVSGEWARQEY